MRSKAVGKQYLYNGDIVTVIEMIQGKVYYRNSLFGDNKRRKLSRVVRKASISVRIY